MSVTKTMAGHIDKEAAADDSAFIAITRRTPGVTSSGAENG